MREMAANPLGAFLLLGLDITTLSVAWPSLPEVKKIVRSFRMEDARTCGQGRNHCPDEPRSRGMLGGWDWWDRGPVGVLR